MPYRYKVYVYDEEVDLEYPIIITKDDINDFCKWLNVHIVKWSLEVTDAYLVNENDYEIKRLALLPTEYYKQYFIPNYEDRLLAHAYRDGIIKRAKKDGVLIDKRGD